jgi:hypothetical protein
MLGSDYLGADYLGGSGNSELVVATRAFVSVQGTVLNADGSAAEGFILLRPTDESVDLMNLISSQSIAGTFDSQGRICALNGLALEVLSSDEPSPTGVQYICTLSLSGQIVREFNIVVSLNATSNDAHASLTMSSNIITLGDLIACDAMIGQYISGYGISSNATVTAYDAMLNTIAISASANTTGISTVTIGGVLDFTTVVPS